MRYFQFFVLSVVLLAIVAGCEKFKAKGFYYDVSKAAEAANDGHYEIADKLWKDLALKYPDKYEVFYNWGTTLVFWGNCGGSDAITHYQQACIQLEKAASLNSNFDQIFYNWGNAYARIAQLDPKNITNYSQACEKFQKATEINPNHDRAFCDWGIVLLNWGQLQSLDAQDKYLAACDKFQKATSIKSDMYGAFNSWGIALICLSKIEKDNKMQMLKQAETVFLKSEAIKKGHSDYNLACVYALLGEEEKCKEWLNVGEEAKTLPTQKYAMEDDDLALVWDKDWFKAIHWKGE